MLRVRSMILCMSIYLNNFIRASLRLTKRADGGYAPRFFGICLALGFFLFRRQPVCVRRTGRVHPPQLTVGRLGKLILLVS
jgi:hypothetical protein